MQAGLFHAAVLAGFVGTFLWTFRLDSLWMKAGIAATIVFLVAFAWRLGVGEESGSRDRSLPTA